MKTAQNVSTIRSSDASRYIGSASTVVGTSTPVSVSANSSRRPGKLVFAMAYPHAAQISAPRTAPPPAYSTELSSQFQKIPFSWANNALTLAHRFHWPNSNAPVVEKSPSDLVADVASHTSGSRL